MKPPFSILDPRFKYRSSAHTDVRKTWRKARLLERLRKRVDAQTVVPLRKQA